MVMVVTLLYFFYARARALRGHKTGHVCVRLNASHNSSSIHTITPDTIAQAHHTKGMPLNHLLCISWSTYEYVFGCLCYKFYDIHRIGWLRIR